MRVLYLTPGCFDKGGISRYSRYQIRALRDLLGAENVSVLSLLGPGDDSFEEPFEVDWHGSGADSRSKLELVARASSLVVKLRPDAVHVAHVNFAGLARWLGSAVKATVILNVYRLEVWSGFRPDAEWGLRRADLVVSDCHFTASYLLEAGLRTVKVKLFFMPPEWRPAGLSPLPPHPEVTPETYVKYDTKTPLGLNLYVFVHFLPVIAATFYLLQKESVWPAAWRITTAAMILLALLTLGGILEKRKWAFQLEFVRLAMLAAAAITASLGHELFMLLVLLTFVLAAVVTFWLGSYRHIFGVQAPADVPSKYPGHVSTISRSET